MKGSILEQASRVVEDKTAKFHKDFGDSGYYEGFGFRSREVCPDIHCKHYKYAGMGGDPVCTHPGVTWVVEIGGVQKCPVVKVWFVEWLSKWIRVLRK